MEHPPLECSSCRNTLWSLQRPLYRMTGFLFWHYKVRAGWAAVCAECGAPAIIVGNQVKVPGWRREPQVQVKHDEERTPPQLLKPDKDMRWNPTG